MPSCSPVFHFLDRACERVIEGPEIGSARRPTILANVGKGGPKAWAFRRPSMRDANARHARPSISCAVRGRAPEALSEKSSPTILVVYALFPEVVERIKRMPHSTMMPPSMSDQLAETVVSGVIKNV